ncbi:MAG: hypothetical protein KGZ65_06075 [Sphingomonadales bacterium]|nr:hypothetical protein [Sphingomonadaceae bacterium]MBS3930786.1 hypothetical protein [Sphingomonadales bacterium]
MIAICKTCGRRKLGDREYSRTTRQQRCTDERHVGEVLVTDNQARDLATAARAYNHATDVEDRATAFNDWLAALTEGLPEQESEQMGLHV